MMHLTLPPARLWPVTVNQARRLLVEEWLRSDGLSVRSFHVALGSDMMVPVEVPVLQRALDVVTTRHTALRSSFHLAPSATAGARRRAVELLASTGVVTSGLYVSSTQPCPSPQLRILDLNASAPLLAQPDGSRMVHRQIREPFDYASPPLLRAALLRGQGTATLILVAPHLAVDLNSLYVVAKDLNAVYLATLHGTDVPPPPQRQFDDFAEWQATQIRDGGFAASVSYWRGLWTINEDAQFSVDDFPFALPLRLMGGAEDQLGTEAATLDRGLSADIGRCARQLHVRERDILLAAWVLTLSWATDRSRLSIWMNFPNRCQPGADTLVGWLVNSHMLTFHVGQDASLRDLIEHVHDVYAAAERHHELPLAAFWQHMDRSYVRSEARVVFDYHANPTDPHTGGIIDRCFHLWSLGRDPFLTIRATRAGSDIALSVAYGSDRFVPVAIRQLLTRMQRTLEALRA